MGAQQENEQVVEDHKRYDELMEIFENPAAHQKKILARILSRNAKAEYLLKYKMNGATDEKTFREKVPVSDYDDYKPYVDRILEGDKSPLLAGDPVTEIWISSGTSRGAQKMIPGINEELMHRGRIANYNLSILKRLLPEAAKCKCLSLYLVRQSALLSGGLPCHPITTAFFTNPLFMQGLKRPPQTSPPEVMMSTDDTAGMYCHLLLGLVQRDEVGRILSFYPAIVLNAMRCLREWWPEICDDIANGTLSTSRVKEERLRRAVLSRFKKDLDLAELLKKKFSSASASSSWDGIIPKLWPNVKVVDVSCNGSLEPYFGVVSQYAGDIPVIFSNMYMSTEGGNGMILDPTCPANKSRFTLFPESAYYDFIPVADEHEDGESNTKTDSLPGEVLDLMSLKEGGVYEILITTLSGLYRYRVGDVLKVVGHYKSNPTFQLLGRANMTLSIHHDKTEEQDLCAAFAQASEVLERELGVKVRDYTSTVDHSSKPAHYVIFWEIDPSSSSAAAISSVTSSSSESIVAKSCAAIEAALGLVYRCERCEDVISPLELRLVKEGTFDLLFKDANSRGTSLLQFKVPRVMTPNNPGLEILKPRVIQSVASQEKPPYTSIAAGILKQVTA